MIVIKFFSDWCDDISILNRILYEFNWDIDSNYNIKYKVLPTMIIECYNI